MNERVNHGQGLDTDLTVKRPRLTVPTNLRAETEVGILSGLLSVC